MKIQFIAQGIPESTGTPAGDVINNALQETSYNSFAAFVAFVSVDGIKLNARPREKLNFDSPKNCFFMHFY